MRLNFVIGIGFDGTAKVLNPDSFGDPSKVRDLLKSYKLNGAPAGIEKVLHYVDPYDIPRVAPGKQQKAK